MLGAARHMWWGIIALENVLEWVIWPWMCPGSTAIPIFLSGKVDLFTCVYLFWWKFKSSLFFLWLVSRLLLMTSPVRIFLWFVSEQRSLFDPLYFPAGTSVGFIFEGNTPASPLLEFQAALSGPKGPHTCPLGRERDCKGTAGLKAFWLHLAQFSPFWFLSMQ